MAEASGTTDKIRVVKPAGYEQIPTPDPSGSPDVPPPLRAAGIRSIEVENGTVRGVPDKTSSDGLVEAAQTVFAVLTAEIAFHEREASKLRKALAPFAEASRQNDAGDGYSPDTLRRALLRFAEEHKPEG